MGNLLTIMIDLHMLTTDRIPKEWQRRSVACATAAAQNAGVEVAIHLSPENPEDFWEARWRGYSLGNFPWATYVDVDDWLEPNALAVVVPYLKDGVDVISVKGWDHHVKYARDYPTDRGIHIHSRSRVTEMMGAHAVSKCCPSCAMRLSADNKIQLEERVVHLRVGYKSLAQQWREHGRLG